jgi:hypothetical protein
VQQALARRGIKEVVKLAGGFGIGASGARPGKPPNDDGEKSRGEQR